MHLKSREKKTTMNPEKCTKNPYECELKSHRVQCKMRVECTLLLSRHCNECALLWLNDKSLYTM